MNEQNKPAAALEPCPFCGSEAIMQTQYGADFWAQCMNPECGCTNGKVYQGGPQLAARDWNRRAPKASAVPIGESKYPFPPSQAFKYACEMVAKQATTIIKKESAAAAPQAEEAPVVKTVPVLKERQKFHPLDDRINTADVFVEVTVPCDPSPPPAAIPERVQPSIDSAEFRRVLTNYAHAWAGNMENTHTYFRELTAHIDAKIADAWQSANILRDRCNQLEDANLALLDRATAAEEKLASIRAALDK